MAHSTYILSFGIYYDNKCVTGPRGINLKNLKKKTISKGINDLVNLLDHDEDPSYFFFEEYDVDRIDYKILKNTNFRDRSLLLRSDIYQIIEMITTYLHKQKTFTTNGHVRDYSIVFKIDISS